jgi:Holliday junction resolvase-like predicted endonuclease
MDNILISKSSRHSKITGNFAEHFVLYWLSKYGFECAYVDHVGIDLIANNPHTSERMGISVKARSRSEGTENDHMVIGPTLGTARKINNACKAFGLEPYLALVIDDKNSSKIFILSLDKFVELHKPKKQMIWYMGKKWMAKYLKDEEIKIVEFNHNIKSWWR